MSTTDRIAEHHKKWEALPLFPQGQWVASPDDVEAWSDLMYMRDLADEIDDQATRLAADPIGVHQVQLARLHSQVEVDVLATTPVPAGMFDPWPTDLSNGLLAAWRDGIEDEPEPEVVEPTAKRGGALLLIRRILCVILSLGVLFGIGAAWWITDAKAAPGVGCETIRWGFLGSQRRTVCDTPRRADGSWTRAREVWVPAGWVPGWCSRYSCTSGYYNQGGTIAYEEYPVTDGTVLPDEPGWLPTGSVVIR